MADWVEVVTGDPVWDGLFPRVKAFLAADTIDLVVDGERVHGYRSPDDPSLWLRDHSDMLRGARHVDRDLKSAVDHFARHQAASGALFDFVRAGDGRENWVKHVRVPVEADVEYRFVKALFLAWQATGDDAWAAGLLPAAERALEYTFSHPWRWDAAAGLPKRAYTIDTWDFALSRAPTPWLHFQIDENTLWGIFHGDCSGLFEACRLLARLLARLGRPGRAGAWARRARALRERANGLLWNGRFYRHRHPLDGFRLAGVDEAAQLSLSNPMAANRGLAGPRRARAIVDEYRRREAAGAAFAGWWAVDPPFPAGLFGDPLLRPGAYVNGGILPLAGGELARAALASGREEYGVAILRKYEKMIRESGRSFLWYFPDGTPSAPETSTSPEASPTDGWGSSAMLWAFLEGLCGVVDGGRLLAPLRLAPRWVAAGVAAARVRVGYPASGAECAYGFRWEKEARRIELEVAAPGPVALRVLLPSGAAAPRARSRGREAPCRLARAGGSPYAVVTLAAAGGPGRLEIAWEGGRLS